MKSFFIIDVESVGLHGEGFAVAGGVYLENGSAQWEFSLACPPDHCHGDSEGRKWIKENIPVLTESHRSPLSMRDDFWDYWMRAKREGSVMAAECLWPVEANFVAACIQDDEKRTWNGPYPFHEIASIMLSAGMDPMTKYDRNPSELPIHNPLADARQSARLLAKALEQLRK